MDARKIVVPAAVLFAVLQLSTAPGGRNPRTIPGAALSSSVNVPPRISAMLDRACMDCHSNQTRWPWYSRVAPFSMLLRKDVEDARREMNFSDWATRFPRPAMSASMLAAACADVESGHMPKPRYLLLHPGARLSAEDRRQFCAWTREEITALIQRSRRADAKSGSAAPTP